jgi:hypothetical protein
MPRNGSGVYSLPAGNPVVTGTIISSTVMNNTTSDIATALTGSLSADGQTAWTGNQNANSNRLTNLTAGVNSNDATTVTQVGGLIGALSYRNKIRNPKHEVAQRGTSITGVTNNLTYTLDGWAWWNSGASTSVVTVSQQADVISGADYQYSLRVTVTTADTSITASKFVGIYQPIEGYLVRDLIGNPIALRFDVRSAKTGTHCVSIQTSTQAYVMTYNVAVANTWQTVTLTLPVGLTNTLTSTTTGLGINVKWALLAGANFLTTAGTWQNGAFTAVSGQVNVLDTIGNIFAIGGVQLERARDSSNVVSTMLEHRTPTDEISLNQRYYETGGVKAGTNATTTNATIVFKVPKRGTPTMAYGNSPQGAGTSLPTGTDWTGTTEVFVFANATTLNCGWTASAEL